MASVVVSGGTGGLGSAVTRVLLEAGWHVVVPYVDERELDRVERHPELQLIAADLFDEQAVAAVVAQTPEPLGALVNLVGGFAAGGRVHETPIEDFEQQFRLNLRSAYLLCHAALPRLMESRRGDRVRLLASGRQAFQRRRRLHLLQGRGARIRGCDGGRVHRATASASTRSCRA